MIELSDENLVIAWKPNGRCRTDPGQTSSGDECIRDFSFSDLTMNMFFTAIS